MKLSIIKCMTRDLAAGPVPDPADFDGVLVDAPCSNSGTWARNPDARWRTTIGDIRAGAEHQLALLGNASSSVKPGGKLIYAVCSLARAETTEVIERFREAYPAFEPRESPGFVYPWEGPCNGMFIASFQRIQCSGGSQSRPESSDNCGERPL